MCTEIFLVQTYCSLLLYICLNFRTRLAKQSGESQPGPQTVSCRADNNPPPVGGVAPGDTADSNAFISYVLNPPRGVSAAGIFLFDASRGLPSQSPHQIQPGNEAGSRNNDTHNGRYSGFKPYIFQMLLCVL